eukprot:237756_1
MSQKCNSPRCGKDTNRECYECNHPFCDDHLIQAVADNDFFCANCHQGVINSGKRRRKDNTNHKKKKNDQDHQQDIYREEKGNKKGKKKGKVELERERLREAANKENEERKKLLTHRMDDLVLANDDSQHLIAARPLAILLEETTETAQLFVLDKLSRVVFQSSKTKMREKQEEIRCMQVSVFNELLYNKQRVLAITDKDAGSLGKVLAQLESGMGPAIAKLTNKTSIVNSIGGRPWNHCQFISFYHTKQYNKEYFNVVMDLFTKGTGISSLSFEDCKGLVSAKSSQLKNKYRDPIIAGWNDLYFGDLETAAQENTLDKIDFWGFAKNKILIKAKELPISNRHDNILKITMQRRMIFGAMWQIPLFQEDAYKKKKKDDESGLLVSELNLIDGDNDTQ